MAAEQMSILLPHHRTKSITARSFNHRTKPFDRWYIRSGLGFAAPRQVLSDQGRRTTILVRSWKLLSRVLPMPANGMIETVVKLKQTNNVAANKEYQIDCQDVFGQTFEKIESPSSSTSSAFGAMANFLVPKLPAGLGGSLSRDKPLTSVEQKEKHAVREPIKHNWSLPGYGLNFNLLEIFKHELIQHFTINFFSKSSNPPFTSIEMDHSDSGREGCTVTSLTVIAEPTKWRDAIKVAVHEVRRFKEFGVTNGELTHYMDALIKYGEQLATMIDSVPSVDNLDFIMESDALGHTIMDQTQAYKSLVAVAQTVTLEEVNYAGAEVLEYISDYGRPTAPLPTAIVACVPKKVTLLESRDRIGG